MSVTDPKTARILTPSQLNALARSLLEESFAVVEVEGELTGLSRPASGHLYFALKDRNAQIRCALFRPKSQWLKFKPADGDRVIARGRLSLYEPRGDYQLLVEHLQPAGAGDLQREFEQIKARLLAEGLFEGSRKRPLPPSIARLGVLSSPSGAAIHDVLSVLRRRFPLLQVDLLPVPVQGSDAAAAITRMLQRADACARYDVLLLTRGGGSPEDLAVFNDEALARAIAACRTPVVAAIGHEIDVSIADFVADLRCPTPSAAAEAVSPDRRVLQQRLDHLQRRLHEALLRAQRQRQQTLDRLLLRLQQQRPERRIQLLDERLRRSREGLLAASPRLLAQARLQKARLGDRLHGARPQRRVLAARRELATVQVRLQTGVVRQARAAALRLQAVARTLEAVNPLHTVQRGYAILRGDRGLLRSIHDCRPGDAIEAQLHDGRMQLTVGACLPESDGESGPLI